MNKYRKKPVVIEAVSLTRNFADQIFDWIGRDNLRYFNNGEFTEDACYCEIKTLEGIMIANEDDYIIKGVKGEFYPCKPDIFEMTYEAVDGQI